jgi:hypothetical protein
MRGWSYCVKKKLPATTGTSRNNDRGSSIDSAGEVHALFDVVGTAAPYIQSGAVRALGVLHPVSSRGARGTADRRHRSRLFGDRLAWRRRTQKGTPQAIIERLNRAVNDALAEPLVKARMADLNSDIVIGSPYAPVS